MASKRETLLEYLKSLLATITVANGFNSTVKTVERGIKNIRDINDENLPAIFIGMTHEKRQRITSNKFSAELQVLLVAYVKNSKPDFNSSSTGVELDLDKLVADITKAIETDPLQKDSNGNQRVYDTEITDIATDDGDLWPTSGMVMSVMFRYASEGVTP